MTTENSRPEQGARGSQPESDNGQSVPVENVSGSDDLTPFEQAVDTAREQAGVAAGALRRGEFMRDAMVDPKADGDDRLIAFLSYVAQIFFPIGMVVPIIVLLSESSKKRPFQRYHAVQSLALMITFIIVAVAAVIGVTIVQIVPVIGWVVAALAACLTPIAMIMAAIAFIFYGYQAYKGKRFAIPGLTSFLHDQGWLAE